MWCADLCRSKNDEKKIWTFMFYIYISNEALIEHLMWTHFLSKCFYRQTWSWFMLKRISVIYWIFSRFAFFVVDSSPFLTLKYFYLNIQVTLCHLMIFNLHNDTSINQYSNVSIFFFCEIREKKWKYCVELGTSVGIVCFQWILLRHLFECKYILVVYDNDSRKMCEYELKFK